MRTCRTDEAAFTLLEVVVAVCVLVLAAGLVLARGGDPGALAVEAAATDLAATINLTRERAILGARPLRVTLDLGTGRLVVSGANVPEERTTLPPRVRLRRVTAGDTTHGGGVVRLDFDPAGDALPTRIELADDHGHVASVAVPPASGRAVVER